MNKKDTFNRVVILAIVSIVVASLFNLSCLPWLSMSAGILAGMATSIFYLKIDNFKQWLIDLIPILLGSQIGWAALLI